MRHGEAADDDLAGLHVDHDAAVEAPVAPAVDGVGLAHRGDVAGHAVLHGQPVQMAAVLLDDLGDEGRLPQRREAVARRGGGEAVIERVDEDDAAVGELADVVSVELAGDEDLARHVAGIEDVVDLLVRLQHVPELQDLEQRREQDGVSVRPRRSPSPCGRSAHAPKARHRRSGRADRTCRTDRTRWRARSAARRGRPTAPATWNR